MTTPSKLKIPPSPVAEHAPRSSSGRHRQPRHGASAPIYFQQVPLLAAALALAKETITKRRGSPPTDLEIAELRDNVRRENLQGTGAAEATARRVHGAIKAGHRILADALAVALALEDRGHGGSETALARARPIFEKTLADLWIIGNIAQAGGSRPPSCRPWRSDRPIDQRDLILFDFARADPRLGPTEAAAWSLLVRGVLPDGIVPRRGLTAAEVLDCERRAIQARAKRWLSLDLDPKHCEDPEGCACAEFRGGHVELHFLSRSEMEFRIQGGTLNW